MKQFFLSVVFLILGFSASAYSKILEVKSSIFCKVEGKVLDARSEEGHYECAEALAFGQACFTGDRWEVVEVINSGEFNWDEEWLEKADLFGKGSLSYVWSDGPNELKEQQILRRCSLKFFAPNSK